MEKNPKLNYYYEIVKPLKEKWDREIGTGNPISHYLAEILHELNNFDENDHGVRVLVGDSFVKPSDSLLQTFQDIEEALSKGRGDKDERDV
jgi:hypothetical protein